MSYLPSFMAALEAGTQQASSIPTLALRAYPISGDPAVESPPTAASGFQGRYWYYNGYDRRGYPAAQISDHATTGYRDLPTMCPISLEFYVSALGRGQHLAIWTTRIDWDESTVPSEVDLLEVVIDDENLAAGVLYSCGTHRPGGGGTYISNSDVPQAARVGAWHTLVLDFDGSDLVWTIDGIEVRREASTLATWTSVNQCFIIAWEIGGSWPGLPIDDDPKAQPVDPTIATPWPCEARIRNLSFAGVPFDLSEPTYNRNEYYQEYLDNSSMQPTLTGWVTAYPYGSNLAGGIAGDLRLYGNSEHGISCNDDWTGDGSAPEGTGDAVTTALASDGWSDPFIIKYTE